MNKSAKTSSAVVLAGLLTAVAGCSSEQKPATSTQSTSTQSAPNPQSAPEKMTAPVTQANSQVITKTNEATCGATKAPEASCSATKAGEATCGATPAKAQEATCGAKK